jgi:hypothetical protein
MPLIKHFRADTFTNAFILNAFANALAVIVTMTVNTDGKVTAAKVVKLFFTTITIYLVIYVSMYLLFGFGGGMLTI